MTDRVTLSIFYNSYILVYLRIISRGII